MIERPASTPPETLRSLEAKAEGYFRSARAENTVKAYRHDLDDFATWCKVDAGGLSPFPAVPRTVALYVTDVAGRGLKAATIQRRLAAIAQLHQEAGLDDPTKTKAVRNTWRGIAREIGTYQEGKAPILVPTTRRMLAAFASERGPAADRDRALILLGLAGGYRVSELASLLIEDVEYADEGAVILLRRSKTDKAGGGFYKGIPHGDHAETCPVTHLRRWKTHLRTDEGPVFRAVDRHGNVKGTPGPRFHLPHRQKASAKGGLGSRPLLRALPEGRVRDGGLRGRGARQGHHAPDRPPLAGDPTPLPEDRRSVPEQPRLAPRAVIRQVYLQRKYGLPPMTASPSPGLEVLPCLLKLLGSSPHTTYGAFQAGNGGFRCIQG